MKKTFSDIFVYKEILKENSLIASMQSYAKDLFYINRFWLKFGGLWPPEDKTKISYKMYKIFQITTIIITVIIGTVQIIFGVFENIHDFPVLIELLNMGFTVCMTAMKSAFWLFYGKNIRKIMYNLENEKFHYSQIDGFNPGYLTKKAKTVGLICSVILWIFCRLTLAFAYIPAVLLSLWYYVNNLPITNVIAFQKLPFYSYVPFSYDSSLKYLFACVFQFVPFYLLGNALVGIDGLFMNILNVIETQMQILQEAFKSMRKRCLNKINGQSLTRDGLHNSQELEEQMMLEMVKSIDHLEMLIWSCNELEENFRFITLAQALGTLYILCSSLLLLSTTVTLDKEFGSQFFYFAGIIFQLFLYCWFGNQVTLRAAEVPQAIWEGDWIETQKPFKFCMLLTIIRMRKPIYLTAGKFAHLTLRTFVSVLKGSYTCYTVLKTMNN